jgi:cbb3-type cytochrome oxidase subunit 3
MTPVVVFLLLLVQQGGNFGETDLAEIFSIGTGVFALILLAISLIAYSRARVNRFLFVSAAFALFAVKTLIQQIDLIFPNLDVGFTVSTILVFLDLLVLLLFFLAVVKK